jgi:hypothetical protein
LVVQDVQGIPYVDQSRCVIFVHMCNGIGY